MYTASSAAGAFEQFDTRASECLKHKAGVVLLLQIVVLQLWSMIVDFPLTFRLMAGFAVSGRFL